MGKIITGQLDLTRLFAFTQRCKNAGIEVTREANFKDGPHKMLRIVAFEMKPEHKNQYRDTSLCISISKEQREQITQKLGTMYTDIGDMLIESASGSPVATTSAFEAPPVQTSENSLNDETLPF